MFHVLWLLSLVDWPTDWPLLPPWEWPLAPYIHPDTIFHALAFIADILGLRWLTLIVHLGSALVDLFFH